MEEKIGFQNESPDVMSGASTSILIRRATVASGCTRDIMKSIAACGFSNGRTEKVDETSGSLGAASSLSRRKRTPSPACNSPTLAPCSDTSITNVPPAFSWHLASMRTSNESASTFLSGEDTVTLMSRFESDDHAAQFLHATLGTSSDAW